MIKYLILKVWAQIEEQREKQWLTVQPRKLRACLDALANPPPIRGRRPGSRLRMHNLPPTWLRIWVHAPLPEQPVGCGSVLGPRDL